jgi:hypothetical protein
MHPPEGSRGHDLRMIDGEVAATISHRGIIMFLPSGLQLAAIAVVALPGWASAQSGALAGVGAGRSAEAYQLSTSQVVAPVTLDLAATSPDIGTSAAPAPAPDLAIEPIPDAPPNVGSAEATDATVQGLGGPQLAATTSGIHAHTAKENLTAQQFADRASGDNHHVGLDAALMIVGGAGLLAGLLIGGGGGTALAIGGAVIGLYGLFLYLQ